jgi:ribosomal protein S6--L-glutamate ligase
MSQVDIVMLSYPDVTPQNVTFLRAAAARRDINLREWVPHRVSIWCSDGHAVPMYDNAPASPSVVIHRTITRLRALIIPALRLWALGGTVIVNDLAASVASRDKLVTALRLTEMGLPVVPSFGFIPWESVEFDYLPPGMTVIKPAHGLQGQGVSFFSGREEAEDEARAIRWSDARDIVSEYYVAQPAFGVLGEDVRAFVVDGDCVALARRRSTTPGEPRANITLGAVATPISLDHPAAALAVEATHALGLDYAGVDLLESADGELRILEVDAWAGFSGLESATGADISGRILDLALKKLEGSGA